MTEILLTQQLKELTAIIKVCQEAVERISKEMDTRQAEADEKKKLEYTHSQAEEGKRIILNHSKSAKVLNGGRKRQKEQVDEIEPCYVKLMKVDNIRKIGEGSLDKPAIVISKRENMQTTDSNDVTENIVGDNISVECLDTQEVENMANAEPEKATETYEAREEAVIQVNEDNNDSVNINQILTVYENQKTQIEIESNDDEKSDDDDSHLELFEVLKLEACIYEGTNSSYINKELYLKYIKLAQQINKNVRQNDRGITVKIQTPEGNTFEADLVVVEGLPQNLVLGYNVLYQINMNDQQNAEDLTFSINLDREAENQFNMKLYNQRVEGECPKRDLDTLDWLSNYPSSNDDETTELEMYQPMPQSILTWKENNYCTVLE